MCDYAALCQEYFRSMGVPDVYFESAHNRCYCTPCHIKRGDQASYLRGNPPKTYPIPVGWYRFALKIPSNMIARNVEKEWHRAYHGTVHDKVDSILAVGKIVPTGRRVLGGKRLTEREFHIKDTAETRAAGFNTKMTYLSPSICYAGDDCYATPRRVKMRGAVYDARFVFQVYVLPGSYEVKPETIGAGSTRIDQHIPNNEMEWITDREGGHVLTGLLVKLTPKFQ